MTQNALGVPVDAEQLIAHANEVEEWYALLQSNFSAVIEPDEEVASLVDSKTNVTVAIHRWYSLKESFSHRLPNWICERLKVRYGHEPKDVLDPFLGSGTTGVSLGPAGLSVTGVEYNPFIRMVASAKATASCVSLAELRRAIKAMQGGTFIETPEIPALTTFHNDEYVDRENLLTLLRAYARAGCVTDDPQVQMLLRLGVASSIEFAFDLRKDGRALRYVPGLATKELDKVLFGRWAAIVEDTEALQNHLPKGCGRLFDVFSGSATNLASLCSLDGETTSLEAERFDSVMYSPPYLNGFDYTEIYKLELWLTRELTNYKDWHKLRLGTLRSHWSVAFPDTTKLECDPRTSALSAQINKISVSPCLPRGTRFAMKRIIRGYFDDMYMALSEQYRTLRPGGMLVYVVANSRHHYLPVATDLILAEIARCIGFEPLELVVLRKRNGRTRQKHFLRESAVFFRRPLLELHTK